MSAETAAQLWRKVCWCSLSLIEGFRTFVGFLHGTSPAQDNTYRKLVGCGPKKYGPFGHRWARCETLPVWHLRSTQIATANYRCQGLTIWGAQSAAFRLEGRLPDVSGEVEVSKEIPDGDLRSSSEVAPCCSVPPCKVCLVIAAEFDSQWGRQALVLYGVARLHG